MTEDETTWAIERAKAYELFGGTWPSDKDEADIRNCFHQHPAAVIAEIHQLATAYDNGRVHTPWRALHAKLQSIAQNDRRVSLNDDTRTRIAENWMRNAGCHFLTWEEARHELFEAPRPKGGGAYLTGLEDSQAARFQQMWEQLQPLGAEAQADLEERGRRYREAHERARARE